MDETKNKTVPIIYSLRLPRSLRKQPSFFAPGPSGVSREVSREVSRFLLAKRHSGRERRRTAVFAGYLPRGRRQNNAYVNDVLTKHEHKHKHKRKELMLMLIMR